MQQTEVARSVRNLTQKHVNPNSMEKQKAKPAIDMFSKSLTGAIRMHAELHTPGFENVEPTVQFMELVHRWYAIHDTCNTTEFAFKRLPDKKPFYSSSDERLYFLEIEFPEMLRKWESEIQTSIQSIPCEEKKKIKDEKLKFLTKETYQALLIASLSTVQCVKYLLDELKFKFVLTRRLSSDNVEQFFGAVRQMAGGNSNCDAVSVSQSFEKILRTGIAETSVNGNTILRRETEKEFHLIRNNESGKKRTGNELLFLPSSELLILEEFLKAPGEFQFECESCYVLQYLNDSIFLTGQVRATSQAATVAFLGGYIVKLLEEHEFCQECIDRLKEEKSLHPLFSLIRQLGAFERNEISVNVTIWFLEFNCFLDRGALLYPSLEFVSRLWTIY